MKNKILCIALFLGSCLFYSCSSEEEYYSCDPEVNQWVKENYSEIKKMNRNQWLNLDEKVKGPVFNVFDSNQKKIFWEQKLKEVLQLNWNEKESAHLHILLRSIQENPNWFGSGFSKNESEFKKFELFIYAWVNYAYEELNWNKKLIGGILTSGNKLTNEDGTLVENNVLTVRLKRGGEGSCTCHIQSDFCSFGKCKDTHCIEQNYCGWLLLQKCDGQCT